MPEKTQEDREEQLKASIEKLKRALAYEAAHPDFSKPTPAEAARAVAERMDADARRAIQETRFVRFPG